MTSTKPRPQEANLELAQGTQEANISASKYANIKGPVNLARLSQWKKKEKSNDASRTPLLNVWTFFLATSMVVTGPSKVCTSTEITIFQAYQ